jgi:hypothetical protein
MRPVVALCLAFAPFAALAQGYGPPPSPAPLPPQAPESPPPGAGDPALGFGPQQGYGGCNGCSYSGDYFGSGFGPPAAPRRPAPPLRLQGQWRNGRWYY